MSSGISAYSPIIIAAIAAHTGETRCESKRLPHLYILKVTRFHAAIMLLTYHAYLVQKNNRC